MSRCPCGLLETAWPVAEEQWVCSWGERCRARGIRLYSYRCWVELLSLAGSLFRGGWPVLVQAYMHRQGCPTPLTLSTVLPRKPIKGSGASPFSCFSEHPAPGSLPVTMTAEAGTGLQAPSTAQPTSVLHKVPPAVRSRVTCPEMLETSRSCSLSFPRSVTWTVPLIGLCLRSGSDSSRGKDLGRP